MMKLFIQVLLFSLSICFSNQSFCQEESSNSDAILLGFGYAFQTPVGELADRFGVNNSLSFQIDYMTKQHWMISLQNQFLFGNKIKEITYDNIINQDGEVINNDRNLATLSLRERGNNLSLNVGKIFDIIPTQDISGIKISFGLGYLFHKIRIKDNESDVTQFEEPNIEGYDRLTGGLSLHQFVGYQHLDNRGQLNFFGGFEAIEGFTKDLRGYAYNTNMPIDGNRLDLLLGFRMGIQIGLKQFRDIEAYQY